MVVWFAHVRVGHRQLPIPKHPPCISKGGVFLLCGLLIRFVYSYDASFILLGMLD